MKTIPCDHCNGPLKKDHPRRKIHPKCKPAWKAATMRALRAKWGKGTTYQEERV